MHRTLCAALSDAGGGRVEVAGWVHRRRRLSAVTFLIIRDSSGLAQVVVTDPGARADVDAIGEESVVRILATITANPHAPGGYELTDPDVSLLGPPAETPPFELWRPALAASLPTQLDHGPISWRHPARRAVWQLAAASVRGFRSVLDAKGFTEIQSPKIVGGSTESGSAVFEVDYFGRPAYLAQSPQFYKQIMVGVFDRVYETGPVFRAEPHDTTRHLAEYVSLDAELGFIRDHRDVLAVLRDVLAGMVGEVRRAAAAAAQLASADLPEVPAEIPVITFPAALQLVGGSPDEPDLSPDHERQLGHWAAMELGSEFLAVEGYPAAKRPFYTHPQSDDPRWTNSFDLLFRGQELVTGGQRLHEYSGYRAALTARGEDPAMYEPYLQAFRHGMPPHGGFAMGLERWTARLVGADNIRSTTLSPGIGSD